MGIKVFAIGVGSTRQPIPLYGELLTDKDGNNSSAVWTSNTQGYCYGRSGAYVRAGNSEFGLDPIVDSIQEMDADEFKFPGFESTTNS